MNTSQIEAFCAVVKTGSISEAARELNCNRSSLSMAIKALERELETDLFIRSGNQLSVSEAGKAIYKDCDSVLIAIERIKHTCTQVSTNFNAEMWVARDDSLPDDFWQDLAHELSFLYPATSFNLVLASTGDLANLVATKQVDFAFGVDYERANAPRVTSEPQGKIRMMSVCKQAHPLSARKRVNDEELRNEMQAVMVYLNDEDNSELKAFSRRYLGFTSFDYMLNTILSQKAWGVLPEPLIRHLLRDQSLTVIKHTYGLAQENYCMFRLAGAPTHPGMEFLCDKLSDYLFDF